ncbi:PROTECTION OF TELOMERES PROTEIN 1 [Ceraceosorus bombacis]|uniref:PROTECTION OF TELOMERES PROTEIN 1 n=1 Tax=Ceraceosorus bombacis TaxID=401625 RepID=A0A0P1BGS0_9BASI|nr:PROTECTION OF TELOMERES PROTEIN 1 [Ceraceosorus bombacis]
MTRTKKGLKQLREQERSASVMSVVGGAAAGPSRDASITSPSSARKRPRLATTVPPLPPPAAQSGVLHSINAWRRVMNSGEEEDATLKCDAVLSVKRGWNERYEELCLIETTASGARLHLAVHHELADVVAEFLLSSPNSCSAFCISSRGGSVCSITKPGTSEPIFEYKRGTVRIKALWKEDLWCVVDEERAQQHASTRAVMASSSPEAMQQPCSSSTTTTTTTITPSIGDGDAAAWLKTPACPDVRGSAALPRLPATLASESVLLDPAAKRSIGGTMYTPLSLCKGSGMLFNMLGVIVTDREPRRCGSGTGDPMLAVGLRDASLPSDSLTINMFADSSADLPHPAPIGSVLLLRSIKMQALAGVKYKDRGDWALLHPSAGLVTSRALIKAISPSEQEAMRSLAAWHLDAPLATTATASKRRQIQLCDLQKGTFCDVVVEVVKVFIPRSETMQPPEVYVTDYTCSAKLLRANNFKLGDMTPEEVERDRDRGNKEGGGYVCAVSLFDAQTLAAQTLCGGDVVRMANLKPKEQPGGMLSGVLGGRPTITVLRPENPEAVQIADRKRRVMAQRQQERQLHLRDDEDSDDQECVRAADAAEEEHSHSRTFSEASRESSPANRVQERLRTMERHREVLGEVQNSSGSASRTQDESSASQSANERTIKPEPISPAHTWTAPGLAPVHCMLSNTKPITLLDEIFEEKDEEKSKGALRVRVRAVDCKPDDVDLWVRVTCEICKEQLPKDRSFCAACADEEGSQLSYKYLFSLLVRDASDEDESAKWNKGKSLPVVFSGEAADHFLHGLSARQVRNDCRALSKLRKRLVRILGRCKALGLPEEDEADDLAMPFEMGIIVERPPGGGSIRARLLKGSTLEK